MAADFRSDPERNDETQDATNDDAFTRLEKEMAAMKNAIGGLSDQIADATSDIGTAAQEQTKRGLKYAREYGGENADSIVAGASNRVGAAANAAQSQASSLAGALEDAVRERPLYIVALALGLGFLLGATRRR